MNSLLSQLDNEHLVSLLESDKGTRGWGRNHVLKFGRTKVFVKRLPVTDVECDHMFSSKNFYNLPTYYNYGVGSAGLGVFREIISLIKITNWVLEGSAENFPLLYHHRIVPFSGEHPEVDMERHRGHVRYWNGNKNISRYLLDRRKAHYEAILLFEHMPYMLWHWLEKNMDQLEMVLEAMKNAINFLLKNEVIHFDCHFGNIVTDGRQVYLADFGLVLDRSFNLNKREQDFFRSNKYYDGGEFLCGLGSYITYIFGNMSKDKKGTMARKYGIESQTPHPQQTKILVENIENIHADGIVTLDSNYVDQVVKYRDIVLLMDDFFAAMFQNNRKNTKYNHARLRRLLRETKFIE